MNNNNNIDYSIDYSIDYNHNHIEYNFKLFNDQLNNDSHKLNLRIEYLNNEKKIYNIFLDKIIKNNSLDMIINFHINKIIVKNKYIKLISKTYLTNSGVYNKNIKSIMKYKIYNDSDIIKLMKTIILDNMSLYDKICNFINE